MREREKGRRRENRENWGVPRERGIKRETDRQRHRDRQTARQGILCLVCVCVCEREREGLLDIAELILFQSAGLVQI